MKALLLTLLLTSISIQASLNNVVDLYLSSNQYESIKQSGEALQLASLKGDSAFDWNLSARFTRTDSKPTGLFSFQSQQTKTDIFNIGLNKTIGFTGTNVSIGLEKIRYDLSNWSPGVNQLGTNFPERFTTTFTLTQNLLQNTLGENTRSLQKANRYSEKLAKTTSDLSLESGLLELFQKYTSLRLQKTLLSLNSRIVQKSLKLKNNIQKKSKDGLSRKVDLYQAQMSYHSKRANLESIKDQIEQVGLDLDLLIGKNIRSEAKNYDLYKDNRIEQNEPLADSPEVIAAKYKYLRDLEGSRSRKGGQLPELLLSFQYKADAINDKFSEAFSDAFPTGNNRDKIISLSLNYPIGTNTKKIDQLIAQANASQSKAQYELAKQRFSKNKDILKKRLTIIYNRLKISQQALRASSLMVKEQSRRYSKGQIDSDSLIRAEEQFINTQLSTLQNIWSYEQLSSMHAFLYGRMLSFTKAYKE